MSLFVDGEVAERIRRQEAAYLDRMRKLDPGFDPWRPAPPIPRVTPALHSPPDGRDAAGGMADAAKAETAAQHAPEPLVGMPPRDALRQAQAAYREALAARDRAQELADRAKQRAAEAGAALQRLMDGGDAAPA